MPVAREITLLRNPTAGRGRGRRSGEAALARLRASGLRVQALEGRDADESGDLARAAADGGTDALVVVGGDGTVHLALQALAGTGVPLGVVPAGRRNRTAAVLGLPTALDAAVERVLAGRTRTADLARSAGRWSVGFATAVDPTGGRRPRGPVEHVVDLDGDQRRVAAVSVLVGVAGVARVTGVGEVPPGGRTGSLEVVVPGRAPGSVVLHARARRVTLAAAGVVGWADGERLGRLPLTVEVVPGVLTLLA